MSSLNMTLVLHGRDKLWRVLLQHQQWDGEELLNEHVNVTVGENGDIISVKVGKGVNERGDEIVAYGEKRRPLYKCCEDGTHDLNLLDMNENIKLSI